jgi:hypothetical protein
VTDRRQTHVKDTCDKHVVCYIFSLCHAATRREMAGKYNIKYFYDIQDRSNFKANPDYKGVCHVALAQVTVVMTVLCTCYGRHVITLRQQHRMLFQLASAHPGHCQLRPQGSLPCGTGTGGCGRDCCCNSVLKMVDCILCCYVMFCCYFQAAAQSCFFPAWFRRIMCCCLEVTMRPASCCRCAD